MNNKSNSASYTQEETERIKERIRSFYGTYQTMIEEDVDKHRRLKYHSETRERANHYDKLLSQDEHALSLCKEDIAFLKSVGAI